MANSIAHQPATLTFFNKIEDNRSGRSALGPTYPRRSLSSYNSHAGTIAAPILLNNRVWIVDGGSTMQKHEWDKSMSLFLQDVIEVGESKSVVTRPADAWTISPPALNSRLRRLIEDIVADVFDIEAIQLRLATRGKARIALARQVAMYIAHVGYGLTLTEVGRLFERDRTTVAHACNVVEARRDDGGFDEAVVLLEQIIRAIDGSGVLERSRFSRGSESRAT